jgi:hypothetical protein
MLAYQYRTGCIGIGRYIEGMGAQNAERLIEVRIAGFSSHGRFQSERLLK